MERYERAVTPEQKRAVVERLYAAWLKVPNLRLGQLIANAVDGGEIFYVPDGGLADDVESYAYPRRKEGK
jgi:hypothetical protein